MTFPRALARYTRGAVNKMTLHLAGHAGAPVLVPAEQATKDIPWLFSFAFRHVVHTAECVQLPILRASPNPATHG